jgi:hypothetical protein
MEKMMEKMRKFSEHPTRESLNISASLSYAAPIELPHSVYSPQKLETRRRGSL